MKDEMSGARSMHRRTEKICTKSKMENLIRATICVDPKRKWQNNFRTDLKKIRCENAD
jgi:hypothetical protein